MTENLKYRTQQLLQLLKKSHKVKFTIDYEVYNLLNLQEHINELKKDSSLEITVIRVIDEMKIYVVLKE